LQSCKSNFRKSIIISQRNPDSFINFFHTESIPIIELEDYFKQNSILKLCLLKVPFTSFVFDLSKRSDWIKNLCTEMVYIITNEILAP
jgi:hypothetical protein